MTNKRVCILTPDLIPVWSGIATYVIGLLKNAPEDIEFHVVTTKRQLPNVQTEKEIASLMKQVGKNVRIYLASSSTKTLWDHARFQAACLRLVPEIHRKVGFDFLHVNFPLMSELLLTITKRVRIPILSTIHTTIEGQHLGVKAGAEGSSEMEQTDLANLYLVWPLRLAEHICLSAYSRIIATSHFIKDELNYFHPHTKAMTIPVIHNGVDTGFFYKRKNFGSGPIADLASKNRPVVLFTGRFVASKGINTLFDAIPLILKKFPEALFAFAGGGSSMRYLSKIGKKIRQQNCYVLGYLPWDDMPRLYSAASVYVMPTLYESFPLRLLESMACENAVVATDVSGIPEVVRSGENGFLVPPKDSVALAEIVGNLLEKPKEAREIGKKARNTIAEGFSAETMARKTFNVYAELLN